MLSIPIARSAEPECLITGVTLYHLDEGWSKPADLFQFGDRFIINASGEGEIRSLDPREKTFAFTAQSLYFERRNLYIFPREAAFLNTAALEYIQRRP